MIHRIAGIIGDGNRENLKDVTCATDWLNMTTYDRHY